MRDSSSQASSHFCAAVIASAHGIKGHVKVKCFLEDPTHLVDYSPFSNETGGGVYQIQKVYSQDKDILIVSLDGVTDRTAAEHLKGTKLMLSSERLPDLSEDTFYHKDLIGLSVISHDSQPFGKVHALFNFGAGELLEIQTSEGELHMIPFTRELIPEVKLKEKSLILSEEATGFLKGDQDGA
jgi:16S rRNA processing protein RimM